MKDKAGDTGPQTRRFQDVLSPLAPVRQQGQAKTVQTQTLSEKGKPHSSEGRHKQGHTEGREVSGTYNCRSIKQS